jgi:hypothetical protein
MADATILDGDIGVNYLANNRQKLMYWIGGTLTEYTMNEVYSAMATLLDETTTIDSGTAFSAETPVEYTTGKIDTGDTEPWYMSFDLMEKITSGALKTSGWTRVQDSNTGIICVQVDSGGAIVAGDRGFTIVHSDGDEGVLLEFVETGGAVDLCFIRPLTSGVANSFAGATSDDLTCNTHVADVLETDGVATTGEMVWANLYSIGTIDPNVHLYLYQGEAGDDADRNRVYSWNWDGVGTNEDWYANGHIDICVALNDPTDPTWSTIDAGYITCFARKYGDLYASFEVANSATAGGRNPIPLQSSADLDNTTGIRTVTTSPFSDTPLLFTVGEIITEDVSGARGIVTGQLLDEWISYIPIDDPQIEFFSAGGQTVTGSVTGYTATSEADADSGPAIAGWFGQTTTPTVTFANTTFDVDDNGTPENYGITIDCKSNPLTEVYEWLKYATRNGEVTNDLNGINGERYIGGEVYLEYDGAVASGTIGEGDDVSQATTLATGVVISHNTVDKILLLRDTRGTFNTAALITSTDNSGEVTANIAAVTFAPKTASPLGTFAGGTFFGARGVLLDNWATLDENSFQLTPIEGGTKERPQAFIIEVTNLYGGLETEDDHDRVSVFRLATSGGIVKKTEYNAVGGETPGDATLVVSGGITQDTPGKSTGGWLVLVDDPDVIGAEYKIRYDSWDTSTFTLSNVPNFTSDAGTSETQVQYDTGTPFAAVKRGDLVYNSTQGAVGYVKTVDSDTVLQLEGTGIDSQSDGDVIEINCIPITVVSDDDVYVPFIDKIAAAASESVSVIFGAELYFRVKVRNTRSSDPNGPIKPYSSDGTVATSTSNQSVPVIRTEDTIISTP